MTTLPFEVADDAVRLDEASGKLFIRPEKVKIKERMRKDVKDLDRLAESLTIHGQMHPILLDDEGYLVAGFRRLTAMMYLGEEWIWFSFRDSLTEFQRKAMELEENIQRQEMSLMEQQQAIALLDQIKEAEAAERGEKWNRDDTAELLGVSKRTVYNARSIVEAAEKLPEVKAAATVTGALKIIEREKVLEKRRKDLARRAAGRTPTRKVEMLLGDAGQLIKNEPDEKFDAIVTNFPFGVDLEYTTGEKPYEDDERYITDLVRGMVPEMYRVLKDDAWLVAWFDVRKITYSNHVKRLVQLLQQLLRMPMSFTDEAAARDLIVEIQAAMLDSMGLAGWLEQAGFNYVQTVPCVWVKPNKSNGRIGDSRRGMVVAYETFIYAAKGDAVLLRQGMQNIRICDTAAASERVHSVQMPVDLCREVISTVVFGGSHILDPFAGSGSIGLGALDLQCDFTGYEIDPIKHRDGKMRLGEHIYAELKDE